jgi:hypothetical protein
MFYTGILLYDSLRSDVENVELPISILRDIRELAKA